MAPASIFQLFHLKPRVIIALLCRVLYFRNPPFLLSRSSAAFTACFSSSIVPLITDAPICTLWRAELCSPQEGCSPNELSSMGFCSAFRV